MLTTFHSLSYNSSICSPYSSIRSKAWRVHPGRAWDDPEPLDETLGSVARTSKATKVSVVLFSLRNTPVGVRRWVLLLFSDTHYPNAWQ
jgi:hypothetical protein